MENLPPYLYWLFILVTCISVWIFARASRKPNLILALLLAWLALQGVLGMSGFYTNTAVLPPRFLALLLPPMLAIVTLFVTPGGRHFIDQLDQKTLTLLHIVRVPVEFTLYLLASYQTIPELMTFEGRNWDVFSGVTALLIWYFGYYKHMLNRTLLLIWNFVCLGLLLNIMANGILSTPYPFQQFAFDQPNIAILHFPYLWLPGVVVPLVLFSHLAVIRQLLQKPMRTSV